MKQLKISLLMLLVFTVLAGFVYPAVITGIGMLFFRENAQGSLIINDGAVKGSGLIGQNFTKPEYFHGRPSAVNYDPALSGGSNLGPTNRKLVDSVKERSVSFRKDNGLDGSMAVPDDLLFSSGSGLDPHISIDGAMLQVKRIAETRKIESSRIIRLIESEKERQLPFYGKSYVNVMKLNMELDKIGVKR